MSRIRFLAAFGLVAAAGAAGTVAVVRTVEAPDGGPRCGTAIPRGATIPAAWETTALFVTEVVLAHDPACGYDLSTKRLRGGLSRTEWAQGDGPVRPFVSRYRPTPVARASSDPNAPEAVYAVSRRVRELMQIDADGHRTIPISVGLAAPDAGLSAYRLVLKLEDGSWRVDRATRVPLRFSDD